MKLYRKSNRYENRTVPKIMPVLYRKSNRFQKKLYRKIGHTKERGLNKDLKKGEIENQFLIFYQNYPKKTNKTDARKTFNKLIKSGVSLDSILSKLTIYKKQIEKDQTDIKYIKNPQRFLNCLEDYEAEEEKKPVSEKKICPSCGKELTGLFCKTCFTQYNEKNGGNILKNVDTDMERSVLASMILSPEYIPNIVPFDSRRQISLQPEA